MSMQVDHRVGLGSRAGSRTIMDTPAVIDWMRRSARKLAEERRDYMDAKDRKARAEDVLLGDIIQAIAPALQSICSKVEGAQYPALSMGGKLYLDLTGKFFVFGPGGAPKYLQHAQTVDIAPLPGIVAVLQAAMARQMGTMLDRTSDIEREARVLEAIASAFKIGSVR